MKELLNKTKIFLKTFLQQLYITVQLFSVNGLPNHAAACAYGLLLSIAPLLLLIAFILSFAFKASQTTIIDLIGDISILEGILNEDWFSSDFFTFSKPGISGIVTAVSIIWSGRILSLSMQRGLKITFPGNKARNPITDTLIILVIEAVVLFIILTIIISSRAAMWLLRELDFFPNISIIRTITSQIGMEVFSVLALWLFTFIAYLLIPINRPRKLSAFKGAFLCILVYFCIRFILDFILDITKYNFLYGTLGSLIVLLVNVYFFFNFFLLGAQFAYVTDSFDALLFTKLKQINDSVSKESGQNKFTPDRAWLQLMHKLFFPIEGGMKKYLRHYEKGSVIFSQGDSGNDVFYLLDGEVEFLLSGLKHGSSVDILKAGSFFGEMGHLLSEKRSATIRAKTDVSVFVLPPPLFDTVLKYDNSLDRNIMEQISRRLKITNEAIYKLGQNTAPD